MIYELHDDNTRHGYTVTILQGFQIRYAFCEHLRALLLMGQAELSKGKQPHACRLYRLIDNHNIEQKWLV